MFTCHNTVKILFLLNYVVYFVSADSVLDANLPKLLSQAYTAPQSISFHQPARPQNVHDCSPWAFTVKMVFMGKMMAFLSNWSTDWAIFFATRFPDDSSASFRHVLGGSLVYWIPRYSTKSSTWGTGMYRRYLYSRRSVHGLFWSARFWIRCPLLTPS